MPLVSDVILCISGTEILPPSIGIVAEIGVITVVVELLYWIAKAIRLVVIIPDL